MSVDFYDLSKLDPFDINGETVIVEDFIGIVENYPIKDTDMIPAYTLFLYRGDNRTLRVYVKDPDLNIINLTGAVGEFFVKSHITDTSAIIHKATNVAGEGMLGNVTKGEMFFLLVPADTAGLAVTQYMFSIKVTLSNNKVYRIAEGVINLKQPVG